MIVTPGGKPVMFFTMLALLQQGDEAIFPDPGFPIYRSTIEYTGATAVVEGVGEHGCEYMTSGTVLVLGPTGRNFGAGMANGDVFVWDPDQAFESHVNAESVLVQEPDDVALDQIRGLLQRHVVATSSSRATEILEDWKSVRHNFRHVVGRAAVELAVARKEEVAEGAAD